MNAIQSRPTATDEREIRQLYDELLDAWTRGDANAYGEVFTADVDYVPFDGSRLTGRHAVTDSHDRLFRGVLTGSALVGDVETVRHLHRDIAVVHAFGSVLMPWRSKLPKRRLSRQTLVAVRTAGGWRFTAFHNARVRPLRIPGPTSLPARASRALTRLAHLIGVGRRGPAWPAPGGRT
jgi:uncharacterized protein (TIGR02246 family)